MCERYRPTLSLIQGIGRTLLAVRTAAGIIGTESLCRNRTAILLNRFRTVSYFRIDLATQFREGVMADCAPFTLYIGDQFDEVVRHLQSELRRAGGRVSGDASSGSISIAVPNGTIRGRYSVSGKSVMVTIISRPAMVSCGVIESKLQDIILDAKAWLRRDG